MPALDAAHPPLLLGLSLKHLSLLILVVQNTALGVVMHHSRVSAPIGHAYFFPTAVLLTELFKCIISFAFALVSSPDRESTPAQHATSYLPISHRQHDREKPVPRSPSRRHRKPSLHEIRSPLAPSSSSLLSPGLRPRTLSAVVDDLFGHDCWKLAIPALLYVLQNNLQFVAVSNLEPPVFICAYQLKILTTALFSILLLRKRLGAWQWASLAMLALGVAVVQLQSQSVSGLVPFEVHSSSSGGRGIGLGMGSGMGSGVKVGSGMMGSSMFVDSSSRPRDRLRQQQQPPSSPSFDTTRISMSMEESTRASHAPSPVKGFLAVLAACLTSGLAGVYFEMVLKTSACDLWTRNVQLSAFSLVPASLPVLAHALRYGAAAPFRHFGTSAVATVALQVTGGLAVALVIKHADNILKGFAVSFSILLSFAISVLFYRFALTGGFVVGALLVILSTVSYSKKGGNSGGAGGSEGGSGTAAGLVIVPAQERHWETRGSGRTEQDRSMGLRIDIGG
ncbi:related to UDP-galactose transporter [Pseudozyma flocculosa]|uniref:Related to UDP-galactose transporter n=1 Tax=Pseudozyma flocculosa TaxID=84751 RepID=A0A5C3F109_9BASI|nr:related to UDP-galactose transporter [Pseudozyma flocculosa]